MPQGIAMFDWLYSLPDLLILTLCAALPAVVIVFLPLLVQRIPWMKPTHDNTEFVQRMQATMFTMTALVLAFTLVEAESNYRKIDALVWTEASLLRRIDRMLALYDDPAATRLRPDLVTYAEAIMQDEWWVMPKKVPSERTRQALLPVASGILKLKHPTSD